MPTVEYFASAAAKPVPASKIWIGKGRGAAVPMEKPVKQHLTEARHFIPVLWRIAARAKPNRQ